KNIIKNSKAENIISEAFDTCLTARGKAFIEPYIDYTYDLLNGKLQFNVLDGWQVRIDPNSTKYDLSDARFITKEKLMDKEGLIELFPDKEAEIEAAILVPLVENEETKDEDNLLEQDEDYPGTDEMDEDVPKDEDDEKNYKYLEYHYKKHRIQFLAVDEQRGIAQFFKTETQAKNHLGKATKKKAEKLEKGQRIIKKSLPEIWTAKCIGKTIIEDELCASYPFWRTYPIIPLFGWYSVVGKRVLKREDLAYQGMASSLIDPQKEKNKRRSQALAIVNAITNRGWKAEEGSWVDEKLVKKQGASAGVTLYYKKGRPAPEELQPGNMPSSHMYFEEKSEEDIKLISGVNPDMLSVQDKTTSGRAIALRQQQGLRILKTLFDNLVWTQEILGKYMVSQLSELYTTEKALRVLGSEFINKNFQKNEGDTPELIYGAAGEFVENLLEDPELANYDISIGEGLESPTERFAQYSGMLEMATAGIFIPPEILIEYSDIPQSAKKAIITAQANAPQPEPEAGKKSSVKKRR
ncbi:hypothetical protein LCGC14_1675330, partial [marine sediment metagenome]